MYIPEELLTEAVATDYQINMALVNQWKPNKLYFMSFAIGDVPYIVKFNNQWYSKGPLGRKAFIISVHTVKSSGVLDKFVKKIAHPTKFVSGVLSALMQFNAMVQPEGYVLRFKFKQASRVSSILKRVVSRVPELKTKYNFAFAQATKTGAMGMMVRKNKSPERVFKGIFKDSNFDKNTLRDMDIEDLIDTIAPSLDKQPKETMYRVSLSDIFGVDYPSEEVKEVFSRLPEPRGKKEIDARVRGMLETSDKSFSVDTTLAEKYQSIQNKLHLVTQNGTDLSNLTKSERDTIVQFTGSLYSDMTEFVTKPTITINAFHEGTIKAFEQMDSAFNKVSHPLLSDTEVYRGMKLSKHRFTNIEEYASTAKRYANSPYIKLASYTSFSFSPRTAYSFSSMSYVSMERIREGRLQPMEPLTDDMLDKSGIVFYLIVTGMENSSVVIPGDMSKYDTEMEVIAARGQILKVVDKKSLITDEEHIIVMELEFVDPSKIIVEEDIMTIDHYLVQEADGDPEQPEKTKIDEFAEMVGDMEHAPEEQERSDKFNGLI